MTKFKLSAAPKLQKELYSLLNENISFLVKLEIRNIINSFKSEVEDYSITVNELYQKYGEQKEGDVFIKPKNIKKVDEEMRSISEKEIEIKGSLSKESLKDVKSENEYFIVFDLIK